jgi:hypothetical protein
MGMMKLGVVGAVLFTLAACKDDPSTAAPPTAVAPPPAPPSPPPQVNAPPAYLTAPPRPTVSRANVFFVASPGEYKEASSCMRKYQVGNAEAEAEAAEFADPAKAIGDLRALCLMAASPNHAFLDVGTHVDVLKAGEPVKFKVLDGAKAGTVLYGPQDAISM